MSSYTRKQIVRACILTALATVLVGFVFVEVAYWPTRRAVVGLFRDEQPQTQRPRSADLRDSTTLVIAERRTREILEARETKLGIDKQKELMLLWHNLQIWQNMWYLGIRIQKNPMDLWVMQQILYEVQPDFIIETGTAYGGSALYWAHMLDGLGLHDSRVLTVDITDYNEQAARQPLWQQYVQFFLGSSTDPEIVAQIAEMVRGKKVLVALDSNHEGHHVLQELKMYGPLVSSGSYIVVEDTNLDGVPIPEEFRHIPGAGPFSAVLEYLDGDGLGMFEQDIARENVVLTFNPGGWLRRKAD